MTPAAPRTPLPRPIATTEFPTDPYDGHPPNFLDLEIEDDWAYCAIGRAGIGIVNISVPHMPRLIEVLETPGVTEGITIRKDEVGRTQMLAGDFGAGLQLYGRPGE